MSVYRLIGRLAAVSALNNCLSAPWPTIAGPNWFDSKIEPVEDMETDKMFPCGVVYTDYDFNHWNKGAGQNKRRLTTITLELLIIQAREVTKGERPAYRLDCPVTDSEIESSLDFFESQIFRALAAGNEASDAFSYLYASYDNVVSRRGASAEGGQRLAARQISMEMTSVRENASGTIPPEIEAFLAKLENTPTYTDYADRVLDIRQALTAPAGWTDAERERQLLGWSTKTAEAVGRDFGPTALLPPNIIFHPVGPSP